MALLRSGRISRLESAMRHIADGSGKLARDGDTSAAPAARHARESFPAKSASVVFLGYLQQLPPLVEVFSRLALSFARNRNRNGDGG